MFVLVLCALLVAGIWGKELTLTTVSPSKFVGTYTESPGYGVHFVSTEHTLYLVNLNGQELLHAYPVAAGSKVHILRVLGKEYPSNVSIIPEATAFAKSEARLLPSIYHEMAALGIQGPEMPGAMGVYKIAMGVQIYTEKFLSKATCECDCPSTIGIAQCQQPGFSPPQCCDCLGQCGSCGSCWTSVCGDCCWHLGCCGHDICCYAPGSSGCLFPIGFSCGSPYTCSGYDTSCCSVMPNGYADVCKVESFGCTCGSSCCSGGWKC